jgi:hypothetical protein
VGDRVIPKVIHYTWFSGDKKPPLVEKCLQSWRDVLPDYEIIEWNSHNCDLSVVPFVEQAASLHRWAFVSDYFRFDLLARLGGIYLDLDIEVKKPFGALMDHRAFTGFETFKGTLIPVTSVLGSEPGHPFPIGARDIFASQPFLLESGKQDVTPMGARLRDYMIENQGVILEDRLQEVANGLVIYPSAVLCNESSESIVVNHFMASWIPRHKKIKARVGDVLRKLKLI